MRQIVERVKDCVAGAALPRGWAHAVKHQRILAFLCRNIVLMISRVNLYPVHAPRVELRKERAEPVLLLVIDGDRFSRAVVLAVSACWIAHGLPLLFYLAMKPCK